MNFISKIRNTDNYILFIYAYFFLMPWNFTKSQMGVFSVIIFLWWIFKYKDEMLSKIKVLFKFLPILLLILFVFFTYLSSLWSDSIIDGFRYVNKYHKYYILIIPALFTSLNSKEAKNCINILVVSFASYSLFSLFIYLGLFTILDTHSTALNPKGIMGYAIVTQYMAIGCLSSYFLAIYSKNNKAKYLFFTLSLICLAALLVNNSRTAQVALMLSIISIFILNINKYSFSKKKLFLYFSIIVFACMSFLFYLDKNGKLNRYNSAYKQIVKVINTNNYDGSVGLRIYFNKVGYQIIKDNFLFGMGPEDNVSELRKIQENDKNYNHKIYSSYHSEHIDLLTRYGVIGYALLLFSIISLLYYLREERRYYFVALSFYSCIFYISLANATFAKKPINYILISVFILFSIIAYDKLKEKK